MGDIEIKIGFLLFISVLMLLFAIMRGDGMTREVKEIVVSKKLIKWAFKNKFNYWLFVKYIIFQLKREHKTKVRIRIE